MIYLFLILLCAASYVCFKGMLLPFFDYCETLLNLDFQMFDWR